MRPFVRAMLAAHFMYFDDCRLAGEFPSVIQTVNAAITSAGLAGGNATTTVASWGRLIRARYDVDNAAILQRASSYSGGHALADSMRALATTLQEGLARSQAATVAVRAEVLAVQGQVSAMGQNVEALRRSSQRRDIGSLGTPGRTVRASPGASPAQEEERALLAAEPAAAAAPAAVAAPAASAAAAAAPAASVAAAAAPSDQASPLIAVLPPPFTVPLAFGPLSPSLPVAAPSLTAYTLAALYLDIKRRRALSVDVFKQQDALRAKLALTCMAACLTTTEVAQIASLDTPEVDALTIAADCEALVCARVRAWWANAMPDDEQKKMTGTLTLTVTMLDSRLTSLKRAGGSAAAGKKAEMETRMTGQLSPEARSLYAAELAELRKRDPLRTHGGKPAPGSIMKRRRTSSPPPSGEGGGGAASAGSAGGAAAMEEEEVVKGDGSMWASAVAGVVGAAQGAFHAASYVLSSTTT